ncbi:MAG: hypothetical protein EBR30_03525 [Cytophagia bacterium]|nr:hypothetical protein [Cytophagia bacterium]
MNLIAAVYHSLKRKKSVETESERLGISLSQYQSIKSHIIDVVNKIGDSVDNVVLKLVQQRVTGNAPFSEEELIFELEQQLDIPYEHRMCKSEAASSVLEVHENLEAGTSKITGISSTEPRSPEEIIKILKIDTTKWRLSQYWNKEKGTKWLVSALVSRITQEEQVQNNFLEMLSEYKLPQFQPLDPAAFWINATSPEKVCGVLSLQDLHFGKTGNEDMHEVLKNSIDYLVAKGYKNYVMEKMVMIIGPDTLNMDTFGGTTTKGTPVENSEMATEAYLKAFEALAWCIGHVKQFCENLEVVFISGNHDRLSSFHLLHALSQTFREWPNTVFNIDYAERKVITYGENMLCFEHGDVSAKNNPLVYAVEFPREWGACKHRMLYTGHYHGRRSKEFVTENEEHGFVSRIIPALTSSDYYHYHNKYVGNKRSALLHLHEADKGLISEFVYSV